MELYLYTTSTIAAPSDASYNRSMVRIHCMIQLDGFLYLTCLLGHSRTKVRAQYQGVQQFTSRAFNQQFHF